MTRCRHATADLRAERSRSRGRAALRTCSESPSGHQPSACATATGFSSGRPCPPDTTVSSPSGSSSTIRRPSAWNFASRSPARTVTGIVSSPSLSHSGVISPLPIPRRTDASASGRLRRWSSRAGSPTSGGSPANSGWVRQRSMKSSNGMFSSSSARRRSAALRGAHGLVLDPGSGRDEHEARHECGSSQGDVQRDAPTQRVTAQREARGRVSEHVIDTAGERDRALRVGGCAVAGQVQPKRPVAFGATAAPPHRPMRGGCR